MMPVESVVVDAAPPRSLDSPVIKVDTTHVKALVTLCGILAAWLLLLAFIAFDWVTLGVFGGVALAVMAMATRLVVRWRRTRRVWRDGKLVEVTVRRSSLAYKDNRGSAYTLDVQVQGGPTLVFDFAQGQVEGATHPALVLDGWILIVFNLRATALRRLNPA